MADDFQHIHPEVLAAFLGKEPLASAMGHYASREELLRAYGGFQVATFGPATAGAQRCDLCQSENVPVAAIQATWTARIRWRPGHIALFVLTLPLLVPLSHFGMGIARSMAESFRLEDRLGFCTVHPFCAKCKRGLRLRQMLHVPFAVIMRVGTILSLGATVIIGALVVSCYFGFFGFRWREAGDMLPYFLLAALCFAVCIALTNYVEKWLLFPPAVHRLVKRPFVLSMQGSRFVSAMDITMIPGNRNQGHENLK